jgi:hypothetical protein
MRDGLGAGFPMGEGSATRGTRFSRGVNENLSLFGQEPVATCRFVLQGVDLLRKGVPMSELKDDIVAYEAVRADLEASALGKWVVFHDKELIGTFDTFEAAAKDAVIRFGRGPYLIRQIGAAAVTLPASVLYHPVHGKHEMRIR